MSRDPVRRHPLESPHLGEAIKHLPGEFRRKYPGGSWRQIAGMRDFVAHAYFALDLDILWDAIRRDVPELLDRVREIIAAERGAADA